MRVDLAAELALARELAAEGADVALSHYRRDPETKRKPDGTWATAADLAAEARIRARLARERPGHNVLGEEQGLKRADGGPPDDGSPTWIVDPIDGTNNFIAGVPVWATLVALQNGQDSVVGAVSAPALHESYDAAAGLGARFNGDPIHVDRLESLDEALVCLPGAESFIEAGLDGFLDALARSCYRSRGFGDFWGHALVARGAAHVMVEPVLNVWDVAALEPIVAAAGGRISHLDGAPWRERGDCLTTNGALHDEVLALYRASVDRSPRPGDG